MEVKEKTEGTVAILYPRGKIDNNNAPLLEKKINEILDKDTNILVNFGDVDYINSIGIRVLIQTIRSLKEKNRKLALSNVSGKVLELLKVFDLEGLMAIHPTEEKALASM